MLGVVWNINTVLDYIRAQPCNKDLTLMELSSKTAFLLLITTTQRRSDIMGIHLDHIFRDANCFVCRLQTLCKTYSLKNTSCQITKFPSDKYVCPYHSLAWYLYHTKSVRTSCKWLFITTTHTEAAPSTISQWVKMFMADAGIDIATFQAIQPYRLLPVTYWPFMFPLMTSLRKGLGHVHQLLKSIMHE